jgi:hypothetical protein
MMAVFVFGISHHPEIDADGSTKSHERHQGLYSKILASLGDLQVETRPWPSLEPLSASMQILPEIERMLRCRIS